MLTLLLIVTEKILDRDPLEEIRRAFQLFDSDNKGRIELKDLRRVAKEIGDRLEDDELCVFLSYFWPRRVPNFEKLTVFCNFYLPRQAMIDEFDLDQDNAINEQEFFAIMTDDA